MVAVIATSSPARANAKAVAAPTPYDAHSDYSRAIHILGQRPDVREGITAFLDKRPPQFAGRVSADLPDVFGDPQPSWAADMRPG